MDIAGLSKLTAETLVLVVSVLGFMVQSVVHCCLITLLTSRIAGIRIHHSRIRGDSRAARSISSRRKLLLVLSVATSYLMGRHRS